MIKRLEVAVLIAMCLCAVVVAGAILVVVAGAAAVLEAKATSQAASRVIGRLLKRGADGEIGGFLAGSRGPAKRWRAQSCFQYWGQSS